MNFTWQAIAIKDLGRVVTGRTPSSNNPEHFGSSYPFITPSDIALDNRHIETERYVSEEGKEALDRILLPKGAVCFVCIGATIGKICMTSRPSFTNQQINSVIVNEAQHDSRFAFYALSQQGGNAKSLAGGAATPIINKSAFSEIEIEVPDLATQRKIAGILSAYDDLIENNQRRIKILEEMAQSLYREWFVHFRFPGHESARFTASPLGQIPEGWEVKKVGDAFEIQGGGTPSTANEEYWLDGDIQWYSPRDLTAESTMFIEKSAVQINELGLKKSSAKMFPAYSVMLTSRATIGAIAINTVPSCTNQGFITCLPNAEVPLYFLHQWLKANVETFILHASGSTFKEISKGVFKGLDFIQPAAGLVQRYQQVVSPIADQLLNLQRRNQTLRRTRDLLLPKLLSPA
jgi:type I restriction enzyme S subunit